MKENSPIGALIVERDEPGPLHTVVSPGELAVVRLESIVAMGVCGAAPGFDAGPPKFSAPMAATLAGVAPPAPNTVSSALCRWRADLFRNNRPEHDLLINEPATILLDKLPVEA